MGPHNVARGRLTFVQAKNEHRNPVHIDIPLHPVLAAVIRGMEDQATFLLTECGRPFTPAGFGNWFRDRCIEVENFHARAHGLRKTAAVFLAECGATPHEIMSVTGHQTLKEVENYTEGARKAGLANQAFAKMGIAQVSHSPAEEVSHFLETLRNMALRADVALPRGLEPLFSP